MLKNAENTALQNLLVLYTFVLQAEICTTFTPKVHAKNGTILQCVQSSVTKNGVNFLILACAVCNKLKSHFLKVKTLFNKLLNKDDSLLHQRQAVTCLRVVRLCVFYNKN